MKRFTLRNPDGRYRINMDKAGELRILSGGMTPAMFGDAVDALGAWESLDMPVERVRDILIRGNYIKKS
ncbi:MAG: hypothetical protein Q4G60_14610 [bacterium]|nr:hypothetical protein [bacterium]